MTRLLIAAVAILGALWWGQVQRGNAVDAEARAAALADKVQDLTASLSQARAAQEALAEEADAAEARAARAFATITSIYDAEGGDAPVPDLIADTVRGLRD